MKKILLVEDDQSIINALTLYLKDKGYIVDSAIGQKEAMEKAGQSKYDLALVDITLANGNGFSVCAQIKGKYDIPVIFLTASDDEYSVVMGLDIGADDYISKPFRSRELVSRIKCVLRRGHKEQEQFTYKNISVDTVRAVVKKNGQEIMLSALEYRLLLTFINHQGAVLSRRQLLEMIWDVTGEFINENTLNVYIKRLRDKIESNPANPEILITVRGMGYKMNY